MLKRKVHVPATAEILCHGLYQKLPVEASTPVRIDALTPTSVKFGPRQNYAPNYARLQLLIMLYG